MSTKSGQLQITGKPGTPETLIGRRVDEQKLLDMNAYLIALPSPKGKVITHSVKERGMKLFQTSCTQCHNADQSIPVPSKLIPIAAVWPGYKPVPVGLRGDKKLSPILNSHFNGFDDKMIVVDASDRGEIRGFALPLLLDLERTNLFLHDASVKSLDELLDPKRGKTAPHPFYFGNKTERSDVVELLKSFDTDAQTL